jgi:branched-chain amino acid transport system ATP-binding protein
VSDAAPTGSANGTADGADGTTGGTTGGATATTSGANGTGVSLRLEKLSVPRADRLVLRDVSIEIPPGQVTTLLGPNGTGKSTLVLTVAGVLRPTAGRILLGDQDLTKRRPEVIRGAGVAVVPEGRRLLPDLSVADNLRIATYSLSKADAEAGKRYALELFPELKRRWDTAARSLSGGEQQMVVLAQALAARPSILLVDELSLGLAPVIVKRLVPTLAEVAARGVGVLLIEQFAHVALRLANRAYILEGGRIRYDGTAAELKAKPELLHSAYLLRA